jgi:Holliday junction DNA helicase RuvA
MIAKLNGKIEYAKDNYVVVDVSGVGYQAHVSDFCFGKIAGKKDVSIFVHTYVREDTLALYGFLELSEKEMFELLISISGIGPKAALAILSIAEPKTIKAAILNEDSSILTRVSGVGKKTAERVIRELQGKVDGLEAGEGEELIADSEATEALMSMGYSATEAREALKTVSSDVTDVSERIKEALKNIGK